MVYSKFGVFGFLDECVKDFRLLTNGFDDHFLVDLSI